MTNREIFIQKAIYYYGDRYDFSKVNYINSKTKVCIICKKHGEFWVTPDNFLNSKRYCPKCKEEEFQANNINEFIKKFIDKFGDIYDFSQMNYTNCKNKIYVICKKHNIGFWITPDKLMQGQTCPYCTNEKNTIEKINNLIKLQPTIKSFSYDVVKNIIHAKDKNGQIIFIGSYKNFKSFCNKKNSNKKNNFLDKFDDEFKAKYDLSNFEYNYKNERSKIICPIHDEVLVSPKFLIKHKMCPLCYKEIIRLKEEKRFIERSKIIHIKDDGSPKYDYSKVHYINSSTLVEIIDEEYGSFFMTPNNHLSGKGCPKRAGKNRTTEDIIIEFKKIHGDRYDYSKVVYIDAKTKICVICPIHGEFWITPNKHLMGRGCPQCKVSHLENETMILLDEFDIKYILNYKDNKVFGLKSLDFYLPDYKVAIECQGRQHFAQSEDFLFSLNEESLERDVLKNQECEENGIRLFYYTYNNIINDINLYDEKFNNIYTHNLIVGKKNLRAFIKHLLN